MKKVRSILKHHIGNIVDNVSRNKIIEPRNYIRNYAHSLSVEIDGIYQEALTRQREEFARELRGLHTKQAENLHRAIADLLEKWEVVR